MMEPVIVKLDEYTTVTLPCRYLYVILMSERKKVGYTAEIAAETDWSEVIEFRCFDELGEVHGKLLPGGMRIWKWSREENQKKLNLAKSQSDKEFLKNVLEERDVTFGKNDNPYILDQEYELVTVDNRTSATKLQIRRFVAYDEDGQGSIAASRLYGMN